MGEKMKTQRLSKHTSLTLDMVYIMMHQLWKPKFFLTSIPNKANHSCVVFGIVTKFFHSKLKFRTFRYNTILFGKVQ